MLRTACLNKYNEDYKQYSRLVFSVSVHILLSPQEAEEVVQDVFLKYAEEFDSVEKPKYWLVRSATNLSIDRYRRRRTSKKYVEKLTNGLKTLFVTIFTRSSVKEELRKILESLNEKERSLLTLRMGYGYQYDEIAEILGMPEGSVKSSLSRLIAKVEGKQEG